MIRNIIVVSVLVHCSIQSMESAFFWDLTFPQELQIQDEPPMKSALLKRDLETIKQLIQEDKTIVDKPFSAGLIADVTPLRFVFMRHTFGEDSIKEKQIEIAWFLIENGASVNAISGSEEYTPLHYACLWEKPDFVKFLLEKGANVAVENIHGKTPLTQITAGWNNEKMAIARHLIQYGASIIARLDKSEFYSHLIFIDELYKYHKDEAEELVRDAIKYAIEKKDEERVDQLYTHKSTAIKMGIERYRSFLSLLLLEAGLQKHIEQNNAH